MTYIEIEEDKIRDFDDYLIFEEKLSKIKAERIIKKLFELDIIKNDYGRCFKCKEIYDEHSRLHYYSEFESICDWC